MRRRHEALHALTHHHHHALVAAMKMKRAGTEKSQLTIEGLKKELNDFWHPGGNEHFREEEEILFPAYVRFVGVDTPEMVEALREHIRIRALVQEVLGTDEDPIEAMHQLGELLGDHVRKEERVIFPIIEDALPEERLQKLKPHFHAYG